MGDDPGMLEPKESEFGAGIVVCLAKFAEHLGRNEWNARVYNTKRWIDMSESERDSKRREIKQSPHGDAARDYGLLIATERIEIDPVTHMSSAIEMWANGASDHFYDLDRDKAPESLCKLADIALAMGHGYERHDWSYDEYLDLLEIYKQACIDVDKMLGVEPDWGQY
jgi:hypothetical protein